MSSEGDTVGWPQLIDLASLWQMRRESARARETLVNHFLPYARMQAARLFAGRPGDEIDFGDYFQFASIALTEAVDSFDPARQARFETYAAYRIRGAVLDGVASMSDRQRQIATTREQRQARIKSLLATLPDEDATLRSPPLLGPELETRERDARKPSIWPAGSALERLADAGLGLAIGLMLEGTGLLDAGPDAQAPPSQMPYARLEMRQQRERLLVLMRELPESQRQVLTWHYLQGHPFDALATRLSLTKGRVSQLHRAALETLRHRLKDDG